MKNKFWTVVGLCFALALCWGIPEVSASEDDHGDHHEEGFAWDDHDEDEEYHGHGALHNGEFGDAGDIYHYELVWNNGILKLYLYDGEAELIKDVRGVPARWTISPDAEFPMKGTFTALENGAYYTLRLPEVTSEILHIKIEALKGDKWAPLEFLLSSRDKGRSE